VQRKKPLLVRLDVTQPSVIEITAGEHIQFDRVIATPHGAVVSRHGPLLRPGTTHVSLDAGQFCFRTLSDTQLRVVQGGAATAVYANGKDDWPTPPPHTNNEDARPEPPPMTNGGAKGDDAAGETPTLTVLRGLRE